MDPAALAQQATDILVPALPALYVAGKPVIDKGKEVLENLLYEKAFEKIGSKGMERAKALFDKIRSKESESLEVALREVSTNSEDPKAKEELQQEILKQLKGDLSLAREIELIVNINLNIDLVKQIVFGNNTIILNLEGLRGEELIKVMEYLDWKRKETTNEELSKNYSPSSIPQYTEDHKFAILNKAEEISKALECLQKNKLLLFSGIAGVGKTTLARVLLEFRPASVPEPFWFSFQHNQDVNLETMLEELAGYLQAPAILSFKGIRKAGKIDINRLTDELKKRDPVWLVFDDLSYITDSQRKFKDPEMGLLFLALRDNTHQAKIILTSRILPILDNGERLIDELEDENKADLKGLETNFAVDYLKANGLERIEYNILKSLSEGVCGHPFSLKLLVGLAKRHTLENVLKNPGIYKKSKEERIKNAKLLFDKLAGNEKELLERISVFRKPEHLEAINIMSTDETPIDAVDNLLDKSLLETDNSNSYWQHPLVQEFSYEDLKNKKEAHMLALKYYISLQLPENPSRKEDLQPIIEAHHHACKAGEYDLAAAIIWRYNLPYLLDLWGNPRTLIEIYEKLLPKDHCNDEPLLEDKQVHGAVLGNLGNAYSHLGELRKAIEYYEQALKISKEIGDRRGEGNRLGNLGLAYSHLGEPRKAIEYYEQALKISKEIGDRHGEGNHLCNLGNDIQSSGLAQETNRIL